MHKSRGKKKPKLSHTIIDKKTALQRTMELQFFLLQFSQESNINETSPPPAEANKQKTTS